MQFNDGEVVVAWHYDTTGIWNIWMVFRENTSQYNSSLDGSWGGELFDCDSEDDIQTIRAATFSSKSRYEVNSLEQALERPGITPEQRQRLLMVI